MSLEKKGIKMEKSKLLSKDIDKRFNDFQAKLKTFKFAREHYLESYHKDPVALLFIKIFRLSPIKGAFLGLMAVLITHLLGFAIFSILNQEIFSIIKTRIDIIYDFCLIPIVFGYYIWVSTRSPLTFLRIYENGISIENKDEYNKYVTHLSNNIINNKAIYIFSLVASLFVAFIYILKIIGKLNIPGTEDTNYYIFCFFRLPITWIISWYMVCVIFIKQALSIWSFRKLLQHKHLKINMLHPDKCGGLKPISNYLINFTYFIMACGFGFVLLIYRSIKFEYFETNFIIHFSFIIYIIFSCLFFFFPLHPVHKLMKRLKKDMQKKIGLKRFIPNWAFTPSMVWKFVFATAAPYLLLIIL